MTNDHQRRQKKLERRAAKQKQRQRQLQREKNRGLADRLGRVASSPILHCCTSEALWDLGMSNVLISREVTSGTIAFAVFLVDRYCLGVKDAFGNIVSRGEYVEFYRRFAEEQALVTLEPADVRSLVEGAVEYARNLGFEPHGDYHKVKTIFGTIDRQESTEVFEYGDSSGKPYFIAGPNDSPFRCEQILARLERVCGPEGFHYTMPLMAGDLD